MESAHYFSASPAGPFTRKPLTVELAGETRTLQTSAGIFSPDGIDKGTAVLLAEVPAPALPGNLLDIGCGWGPIALTLALRAPHAKVYAVDVNERCITLTNENAAAAGPGQCGGQHARTRWIPDLRFDTIWSNPPIRIGKDELHGLLKLWLPRLAPGGSAWLVVQKNLGSDSLQRWLAAELDGIVHRDPGVHVQVLPDPAGSGKRPASHNHRGAAELDVFVAGGPGKELNADDAAGHVDLPGVRGFRPGPVADGHRGGAGAGSAGLGLPHAALMDPHGDGADAVVDQRLGGHHEFDVGAVGRHRVHGGRREQSGCLPVPTVRPGQQRCAGCPC